LGIFNPEMAVNWLSYLIEKLAIAIILWEKHGNVLYQTRGLGIVLCKLAPDQPLCHVNKNWGNLNAKLSTTWLIFKSPILVPKWEFWGSAISVNVNQTCIRLTLNANMLENSCLTRATTNQELQFPIKNNLLCIPRKIRTASRPARIKIRIISAASASLSYGKDIPANKRHIIHRY